MNIAGHLNPGEASTRGLWSTLSDALWREDELGIVGQLEEAWSCKLALMIAAIWAGSVPIGVYVLTHVEGIYLMDVPFENWTPRYYVALGGLLFSASSVWAWGRTFYNGLKSALWVMLLEGCMIFSHTQWLQRYVLVLIVFTNMMAAGCRAAQKEKKRRATKALLVEASRTSAGSLAALSTKSSSSLGADRLMPPEASEVIVSARAPAAGDASSSRRRAKSSPSADVMAPVPAVRIARGKVAQSSPA